MSGLFGPRRRRGKVLHQRMEILSGMVITGHAIKERSLVRILKQFLIHVYAQRNRSSSSVIDHQ